MSQSNNSINEKETFRDLLKRIAAKGGSFESQSTPDIQVHPEIKKGVKLKPFPKDVACMPNEWTRSGLFLITNNNLYTLHPDTNEKTRKYVADKLIPTFSKNIKISYTGYVLNIFDQTVFLTAVREAKTEELEKTVSMSRYEFCEAARLTRGKKTVRLIEESLSRMFSCSLKSEIYRDGRRIRMFHRHLINKYRVNDLTNKLEIALPIDLAELYSHETTHVNWDLYHALNGEIAKAIALEICSHEARADRPQTIPLDGLKLRIGSTAPMVEFRRLIKSAFKQLLDQGLVQFWKLENDILMVVR